MSSLAVELPCNCFPKAFRLPREEMRDSDPGFLQFERLFAAATLACRMIVLKRFAVAGSKGS